MEEPADIKQAQELLDEFEQIHDIRAHIIPNGLDLVWNLTYEQIQKLTPDQCAEYSYVLAQYSAYVQKIYNRESAKHSWLENKIEELCCSHWNEYSDYIKYPMKIKLISRDNDVIQKLIRLLNFTKQKMIRLDYIPSSIKVLSDKLDNMQRMKSMQNRLDYGK